MAQTITKKVVQITIFLTLVSFYLFGQEKIELLQDTPAGKYILTKDGTIPSPSPCANCLGIDPIVVDAVTGVMTITYSNGSKYVSPPLKGPKGDKGDQGDPTTVTAGTTTMVPYGQPARVTGVATSPTSLRLDFEIPNGQQATGGSGGASSRGYYDAMRDFGAKGDGVTDDSNALQNWMSAVVAIDGFGTLPDPPNFYKITRTLLLGSSTDNQFWINLQGSAAPGFGIRYMGPSGQPAIKISGMKGGSIRGIVVKIGDGVTNSDCWQIGTAGSVTSTASFTFYDCIVETGGGTGNQGWHVKAFDGGNGDLSQIAWVNCTGFGGNQRQYGVAGQNCFNINASNAAQFTWVAGGYSFFDHVFHLQQGGAMYNFGAGGSQNNVDFYTPGYSNTLTLAGNRWESGRQHVYVGPGAAHMAIVETNSVVSDYHPTNGRLYEINQPGSLILDGVKVERIPGDALHGSQTIYMNSSGMGSLFVRGGGMSCNTPEFFTVQNAGSWYVDVKGVGRFNTNLQTTTQFQNR